MAMIHTFGEWMHSVRKTLWTSSLGTFIRQPGSRPISEFRQIKVYQYVTSGMPSFLIRNKLQLNRIEVRRKHHHSYFFSAGSLNTKLSASSYSAAPLSKRVLTSQLKDCVSTELKGENVRQCVWFCPVRHYSSGRETVEKKLIYLMEMWEVEDAVTLLRESVEDNVVPHANVVLNLQQQLANLGEVDCLLELHDFLKEHNLTSDTKFFHCLQEAYYNSGRISEGVAVLRLLYHRTRAFVDVEVYFTLLTVMVIQHFPDRLDLILQFVTDLKDAEIPVLEPEASLWKCYMMMGKWSEADDLLLGNEELRPFLPRQVARICQGVDRVQIDRVVVLSQLLSLPFIRQKLRVLVAETLIAQLVKEKQWQKLLKTLKKLKTMSLPLHADKVSPVFDDLKRHLTPQYDDQIQELRLWCENLQENSRE